MRNPLGRHYRNNRKSLPSVASYFRQEPKKGSRKLVVMKRHPTRAGMLAPRFGTAAIERFALAERIPELDC